jgi:hypothetical protein
MDEAGARLLKLMNNNQKNRKCLTIAQIGVLIEEGYEFEIIPFDCSKPSTSASSP